MLEAKMNSKLGSVKREILTCVQLSVTTVLVGLTILLASSDIVMALMVKLSALRVSKKKAF